MKSTLPSDNQPPATSRSLNAGLLPQRRGASAAKLAATIFFSVFLIVQLVTPIVQLIWAPRPARFGWQMFSVDVPPPVFSVVLDDGTTKPVGLEPYVSSLRGDVPLAQFLPAHLCRVVPQAVAVQYQLHGAHRAETYQCSR